MALNVGILGGANIARKVSRALLTIPNEVKGVSIGFVDNGPSTVTLIHCCAMTMRSDRRWFAL